VALRTRFEWSELDIYDVDRAARRPARHHALALRPSAVVSNPLDSVRLFRHYLEFSTWGT
jgi:hypothetical protein